MGLNSENIVVFVLVGAILFSVLSIFIVTFVLSYRKKQVDFSAEKQHIQSQFRQTLLQSQLEIQEQTLHNISQEIHDNIGQILSLAKLNITIIDMNQPERVQEKITHSRELIAKAIHDLRQLARSMNTTYVMELGLLHAIESEVESIRRCGVFLPRLHIEGRPVKTDPQKELILFRIFQEVTTNIIKHAEAKNVEIRVLFTEELLNITIIDDGKGFDTTLTTTSDIPASGLGLRNIQDRARLIDADFSITSIPGKGTTIDIRIPVQT